jgi:puromycin-sensitive aminopeptidase
MKNSVQLPSYVVPIQYDLTLKPDLKTFTFEGKETIVVDIKKETSQITLHAKELKIASAKCDGQSGKIKYDLKAETATFTFSKPIKRGKRELTLSFKGILNDHLRGFYHSTYIHDGKKKHLATTQFEATDARRAFPCFDEPAQKAEFDISLIVPKSSTAISNTLPIKTSDDGAGLKVVQFAPTPRMSTYLVAFIVGDFEYLEGKTSDGVIVRVYTTPGKKHQGKFALECAIEMLEFYNEYFDISYPLNTLDMIAIPDFASGAMENWGAITYRESALLVDAKNSAAANKQRVALVVAHEIAHQWFGNLVTMEWWTDLWLNEGFASYIEYLAVNHVFPQWDIWTQFAYNDLNSALELDALTNTHPIEVEVGHPDEIGEIFDEVSYNKGASVIRMLASFLGEKYFRNGLRYYLKKHSYQNASTVDLWQAFEKISGKPVRKIMQNWTAKPGYPLIKLKKVAEGNKQVQIKLTQNRFSSTGNPNHTTLDKTVWQVPFSVITGKQKRPDHNLIGEKSKMFSVGKSAWMKFNAGETGFFRTQYDKGFLEDLTKPVAQKHLSAIDRLGVVRDLFALASAGEGSTNNALDFACNYKHETDYTVWLAITSGVDNLDCLLFNEPFYQDYRKYARNLFSEVSENLGWKQRKDEAHTVVLLRSLALGHEGYYGSEQIIAEVKRRFAEPEKLHPDIRGVVYDLVAENGGEKEHKKLMQMYMRETLHEERNRIGRALGKFHQPKLLQKSLEFFMSKNVREQDTPMFMAGACGNNFGRRQTWEFIQAQWPELLKRYGQGGHLLGRFIKPLAAFTSEQDAKKIKQFFKTHAHPGADRVLAQTLEKIESNARWLKRDGASIGKFLESR